MFYNLIKTIRSFTKTEAIFFISALALAGASAILLLISIWNASTLSQPVRGGTYREGVVGQPVYINPVLQGANEADKNLITLLFSPLDKLAERITPDAKGITWNIRLKDGIFWDDGKPIKSDDVIFTIQTIQDIETHSPLEPLFLGAITERISERELAVKLEAPYSFFEDTIKNFRPIPKHIWGTIPGANFSLSNYNLEPVGSGPYAVKNTEKRRDGFITEYNLSRNAKYSGQAPYINSIIFRFYSGENEALQAFNRGVIHAIGGVSAENVSKISISNQIFEIYLPRYYAVFFNPYGETIFQDKNVRMALARAIAPADLTQDVFEKLAIPAYGPLLPGMEGYSPPHDNQEYGIDKAGSILESSGWAQGEDGVRVKFIPDTSPKNKNGGRESRLEFTLIVPEISFLVKTANILADRWEKIGARVSLDVRPVAEVEEKVFKTRDYEMILFGHMLLGNSDLFSFWHSTEKFYPGLNLALYDNETADNFIEKIRKEPDAARRENELQMLQSIIQNDVPAFFLYSPTYIYAARPALQGFNEYNLDSPSDRFNKIENWYIKTARVFK